MLRIGGRLKKVALAFAPGIHVGATSIVAFSARFDARSGGRIRVGEKCQIMQHAMLLAHGGEIEIGDNCSVNPFTMLYGHGGLRIGSNVRIAAHTVIVPANHVFDDPDIPITQQGLTKKGVTIGDDVWIGAGAKILDGVDIATGCVIAAGAVVTKSTEPLGVYVGVPARRVAERGQTKH